MGKSRQPNGHPVPYEGTDGKWHCYVTVGVRPDGSLHRKHVKRKNPTLCAEEVDRILRAVRRGERATDRAMTLADWLVHYLEHIVEPHLAYTTHASYAAIVRDHLIPRLGGWRISGTRKLLQPEHIQAAWNAERRAGAEPTYVLKMHRVLSRALRIAKRQGKASRNPCDLMEPPTARRRKPRPLSLETVKAVITAATDDRMRARWLIALLLGLRQGEVLGLRWRNVDLEATPPTIRPEKQAQRRRWQHGCKDPVACARRHCRTKPCPPRWEHGCDGQCGRSLAYACPSRRQAGRCVNHARSSCPPPCRPGCTGHAKACGERVGGGIVFADLKSEDSDRTLYPDAVIVAALREHLRAQKEERMARGAGKPAPGDLVFVTPAGRVLDPRRDHEAWEGLLERAGVPDAKLHAARHSAATLLVATGTDISVVQEVLGHADIRTTRGYTDVAATLKAEAVDRLSRVLFGGALEGLLQPSTATQRPRG